LNPIGPSVELQKISIGLYQWLIGSHDETYCNHRLSGTTIRGTQIVMENHPTSPFKEKDQQKRDELNSPLLGLQQDM
jgi:hypothetical protein